MTKYSLSNPNSPFLNLFNHYSVVLLFLSTQLCLNNRLYYYIGFNFRWRCPKSLFRFMSSIRSRKYPVCMLRLNLTDQKIFFTSQMIRMQRFTSLSAAVLKVVYINVFLVRGQKCPSSKYCFWFSLSSL